MRIGGISNSNLVNRLRANKMDRMAWSVNGLHPYPWTLTLKPLRKIGQWIVKAPGK
jgi:glycosyltransferase